MASRISPDSREWRIVEEWALKRLHDYRRQLESFNTDERSTLILRGRMAEIRELLKLDQPIQPLEEAPHDD